MATDLKLQADAQYSLPNHRECIKLITSGSCCAVVKRNRDRCYNREKNTRTSMEEDIFPEGCVYLV